jgi:hypothetical protein
MHGVYGTVSTGAHQERCILALARQFTGFGVLSRLVLPRAAGTFAALLIDRTGRVLGRLAAGNQHARRR